MIKKHKLKSWDLLGIWWFVFNLEAIGDDVKRISRYMRATSFSSSQKAELLQLLTDISLNYVKILKSFYDKDSNLMYEVVESKYTVLEQGDKFYKQIQDIKNAELLIYSLRSLVKNVHNNITQ